MNSDDRKRLVRRRAVARGTITRIKNFADGFQEGQDINLIRVRLKQLPSVWDQFVEAQLELELEDVDNDHTTERDQFEEEFHLIEARMTTLVESIKNESQSVLSQPTKNIKLPTINVPKFAGTITEFKHFYDIFSSIIINNDTLDNIQRFYYLLSSLTGDAHKLISNLPVTDSNFIVAWDMICERYNCPKLIANVHIKNLLSLPSATKESPTNLRAMLNQLRSNVNAIEALKLNVSMHELLLTQLILERVDESTRREWEVGSTSKEIPKLEELITFVERRCQALEVIKPNNTFKPKTNESQHSHEKANKQVRSAYMSVNHNCYMCNNDHTLNKCPMFTDCDVKRRLEVIKQNKLCFNCLRPNHSVKQCMSGNCKTCNKKHNTLLHRENVYTQPSHQNNSFQQQKVNTNNSGAGSPDNPQNQSNVVQTYCTMKVRSQPQVLLSTAIVKVKDSSGRLHTCRALLDCGSQSNFVTHSLVQNLNLKRTRNALSVQGINDTVAETKHSAKIELHSNVSGYKCELDCFILPKISSELPNTYVNYQEWNIPNDIGPLADPRFHIPDRIDILIGAEIFLHLLKPGKSVRPGIYPVIQNTELGWILAGRFQETGPSQAPQQVQTFFTQQLNVDQQLQRFWEIEELNKPPRSHEEKQCEIHFTENTKRDENGRFIVRLPFLQDPAQIGDTLSMSKTRLLQLERRLNHNAPLHQEYTDFLDEYESLGHMQVIVPRGQDSTPCYYLPHHPVFKDSSTTKTRVVFDASAKSNNGLSLNDILPVGPTIQQDVFAIVLRFRTHQVCFTSDIAKMYRQIKVDSRDTPFQRILWRKSQTEPIKEYELNTVTYGTATAPFLATRCLQQLAIEEAHDFPKAAKILTRDFYIDDCISGANTVIEALEIQKQLIELLNRGGFTLRKWSSNSSALLEAIPKELRENKFPLEFDANDDIKTLGLLWHPATDQLQIVNSSKNDSITDMSDQVCTKRKVLAVIASIFDPLGLISPIVIICKIFMQKLWQTGLNWDDKLSTELFDEWQQLYDQLPLVKEIYIDRLVLLQGKVQSVELHGFADASERAYGSCIYLRSTDECGNVTVKLLCSKSRVAPVKRITLPRLELCAALLLARLYKKTTETLELEITKCFLWSDSTVVLCWIKAASSRWTTFVANRVTEIQEITSSHSWFHVSSHDNPADLVSRGISPEKLIHDSLWWEGPSWLKSSPSSWPTQSGIEGKEIPEQRKQQGKGGKATNCFANQIESANFVERFSSLTRLQRVIAYCFRFGNNARTEVTNRNYGDLSTSELQRATLACIKIAQRDEYKSEINAIQSLQPIDKKSKLKSLCPILCEQHVLRVGGRLQNADLTYDQKHQIILPPKQHITKLIIEHEHKRLLHAGGQLLLSSLRQMYWIVNAKHVIRHLIYKCVKCYRFRSETAVQQMGQLPEYRVNSSRPFLNTGIDYAGPVYIKSGTRRSKQVIKAYIALFICLTIKAVHIEIVTDLTSQAFIAALKRFISRRGRPSHLYSDNATTFVGANNELRELQTMFANQESQKGIHHYVTHEGINWSFIPARAPHVGGIWETNVKSIKYHLRRVMGAAVFTYEELSTLLTQIEGCLNSRPLTILSSDPSDPIALTPGHFLTGASITALPEPSLENLKTNLLGKWQCLQKQLQYFWRHWSTDYLHTLQQRSKWTRTCENVQPGMVVLIKEDNVPPLQWKLGVIEQTHPGADGLVRVATIRTKTGNFKRCITKLCPLPIQKSD